MLEWEYESEAQTVIIGETRVRLTDTEATAFLYLMDHQGMVVSRSTLEQEVWGFSSDTRSETVPVTMRKIRKKLMVDGVSILATVHGVGWRLHVTTKRPRAKLPTFGTPWFPREAETQRIEELLEDGWRVVSIVGPGGAGKTRLAVDVAERVHEALFFVELGRADSMEGVHRAILTSVGMSGGDLSSMRAAMQGRPVLFVFDEVERVRGIVSEVIDQLPHHRFLLTTRHPLERPDEAIHAVAALTGEEGRRFARRSLRASRWNHSADDATLDALLEHLDGLPLAIEVASGAPEPPERLIETLQAGQHLGTGGALTEAMEQSYRHLDANLQGLLQKLCLCENPMPEPLLVDWLGDEAAPAVRELASRSLVSSESSGWRVLATMRAFVRGQEADWEGMQSQLDTWLCQVFEKAAEELTDAPREVSTYLTPLVDNALLTLPRVEERLVGAFLWVLYFKSLIRGPYALQNAALLAARINASHHPIVQLLATISGLSDDVDGARESLSTATAEDRTRGALMLEFLWLPQQGGVEGVRGWLRGELPYAPRSGVDPARCRAQLADLPTTSMRSWMMRLRLARSLVQQKQMLEAARELEILIGQLRADRVEGAVMFALFQLADCLVEVDRRRAIEHFQEIAVLAEADGYANSWAMGRSGVCLTVLGRFAEAVPMLAQGARSPHNATALACQALLWKVERRLDPARQPSPIPNVDGVQGIMADGTPLKALVEAVLSDQPIPVDTSLARAWLHTLEIRPPE